MKPKRKHVNLSERIIAAFDGRSFGKNRHDDVRLCDAAPVMLKTLQAVLNDCENYLNDELELSEGELCLAFQRVINEAIAKATKGEVFP